jgi:hypothetical protein
MAVVAALIAAGSAWADDLTDRVAASLRDSGALAGYRVNVKSKDGTVWLNGTVRETGHVAAAVQIAEGTPGVERVVNRLTVARGEADKPSALPALLALPDSVRSLVAVSEQAAADAGKEPEIQLVAAREPVVEKPPVKLNPSPKAVQRAKAPSKAPSHAAGVAASRPAGGVPKAGVAKAGVPKVAVPRPLASTPARPVPLKGQGVRNPPRKTVRTSLEGEPMMLPTPADSGVVAEGLGDGQMVPGSMRVMEGGVVEGPAMGGPGMGRPMPMGGTGVGMPPVPVRGNGPNMPNYAWPSYAAYPNYAALQYPTQYSPTAWPYIGPFYPYPQVPLGWRRVSLEWDDGWWFLDFDDRHPHNHHR